MGFSALAFHIMPCYNGKKQICGRPFLNISVSKEEVGELIPDFCVR